MGREVLELEGTLHEVYRVEEAKDINVVNKIISRREGCSSLQNRTNLNILCLPLGGKFTSKHIGIETVNNRPVCIPFVPGKQCILRLDNLKVGVLNDWDIILLITVFLLTDITIDITWR